MKTGISSLVALLALASCSSTAQVRVDAATSRYPISMSRWLVDDAGPVDPERIEVVAPFHADSEACVEEFDISDAVNQQVAAAKGDGITGLAVEVEERGDCARFSFVGSIVRVRPTPPGSAAPGTSAPTAGVEP